jgi:hypothetical protein
VKEGGAEHTPYRGHSSHATCVRWLSLGRDRQGYPTDDYLLSTGGEDKCVFQWRNTDTGADARPPGVAGVCFGGIIVSCAGKAPCVSARFTRTSLGRVPHASCLVPCSLFELC